MRTFIIAAALSLLPIISHAADDKVRLGDLIAQGYEIKAVFMGAIFVQKSNVAFVCNTMSPENKKAADSEVGNIVCEKIK